MAKLLEQHFFRNTVMWGILHFVAISLMSGLLYLVIHISPQAGNLDSLILVLHAIYKALYLPIAALRGLWPGETSLSAINFFARAGGSVLVGVAVAWLIDLRHRRTVG
jgi:hypothetical protein